jgi:hypothetical protein
VYSNTPHGEYTSNTGGSYTQSPIANLLNPPLVAVWYEHGVLFSSMEYSRPIEPDWPGMLSISLISIARNTLPSGKVGSRHQWMDDQEC